MGRDTRAAKVPRPVSAPLWFLSHPLSSAMARRVGWGRWGKRWEGKFLKRKRRPHSHCRREDETEGERVEGTERREEGEGGERRRRETSAMVWSGWNSGAVSYLLHPPLPISIHVAVYVASPVESMGVFVCLFLFSTPRLTSRRTQTIANNNTKYNFRNRKKFASFVSKNR